MLNWRNINSPNFNQSANIARGGVDTVNKGFDILRQTAEQHRKQNIANEDAANAQATADILKQGFGITDQNQLQSLMQSAPEGVDTNAILKQFTAQHDQGIVNEGRRIDNQMAGKELGAFDRNTELTQQGKQLANEAAQTKNGFLPDSLQTSLDIDKANLTNKQNANAVQPDMLQAELAKIEANAKRAGVDADYAGKLHENTLLNGSHGRKMDNQRMSLEEAKHIFNKQQAKSKLAQRQREHIDSFRMQRTKIYKQALADGVSREKAKQQIKLLDVYAKNPTPQNAANYINADGKASNLAPIRNSAVKAGKGKDISGSGNGGINSKYKAPDSFKKVMSGLDKTDQQKAAIYLDQFRNNRGIFDAGITDKDDNPMLVQPTYEGANHLLTYAANKQQVENSDYWNNLEVEFPAIQKEWFNSLTPAQQIKFMVAN